MIGTVIGELGTGKTAFLTYAAISAFRNLNTRIFSNYKLYFEHTPVYHPAELAQIKDGLFIGDELWLWISSVLSLSKLQLLLATIYTNSRKQGCDILGSSQRWKNLHVRFRSINDVIFIPTAYPKFSNRPVYFRVVMRSLATLRKVGVIVFELDEVKELYDTNATIYNFQKIYNYAVEQLKEADVTSFFAGVFGKKALKGTKTN